ncbi:MAG: hypothetical protein PWR01_4690 [Clostridiales bacterium]|nr:hypothetical protein [Clostridiales bacterium]MDN5283617.1 hypothetical protein [Candidatus Ozemobacter sp.]
MTEAMNLTDVSIIPFILLGIIILVSSFKRIDATEKKLQNDFEHALKNRAYGIMMTSDLCTATVDSNLNFVFCNQKFASLFGSETHELVGCSILQSFPFPRSGAFFETLQKIGVEKRMLERPVILNLNLHKSDKGEVSQDMIALVKPIKESDKQLLLIVLVFVEGSEILLDDFYKSIEQKENDLKKMEELDRLKSEFLATLSHELKTPLVSIKGYMDLMASEKFGPLTDGQKKALRVSLRNTSQLNSLISSILNFARMEAGKLRFDLRPIRIGSLISETIDSMKPISDKQQIEIIANIENDLPKAVIDPELLSRVLINLLDNSIKFSPAQSTIIVKAELIADNQIRVSVIDHGCGIDPEKISKIKTPFYQADKSDTRPKGGLGLGLAISEKILVGHGTSLNFVSEPDQGTTVSFSLKTDTNTVA